MPYIARAGVYADADMAVCHLELVSFDYVCGYILLVLIYNVPENTNPFYANISSMSSSFEEECDAPTYDETHQFLVAWWSKLAHLTTESQLSI